jgi:hypothetical protein
MELQWVWSHCGHDSLAWLGIAGGQMDRHENDQTSTTVPFQDGPAQLCNGCPKLGGLISISTLGCAGAVQPEACVLCAAGTYQTGSGPLWQNCSSHAFYRDQPAR